MSAIAMEEPRRQTETAVSANWPLIATTVLLIVLSGLLVLARPWRATHPNDQDFVNRVRVLPTKGVHGWELSYPRMDWSGGISVGAMVGIYKDLTGFRPEHVNEETRFLAAAFYLASFAWLASTVFPGRPLVSTAAVVALWTMGFQWCWLVTDPIAGGFLFWFLRDLSSTGKEWRAAFAAALFGLTRPLHMPAALIMLAVTTVGRRKVLPQVLVFAAALTVLWGPSVYLYGTDSIGGPRSFASFKDYYRWKFEIHQATPSPADSDLYMRSIFPGCENVMCVAVRYPQKYFDNVMLNVGGTLQMLGKTFHLFLLPALWAAVRRRSVPAAVSRLARHSAPLLAMFGPMWLSSGPSWQYFAPVAGVLALLATGACLTYEYSSAARVWRLTFAAAMCLSFVVVALRLINQVPAGPFLHG